MAVPVNTNKRAETDGFLSAWFAVANEGDGGEIYAYTDSRPDPKTLRGGAGIHWYKTSHMWHASLFTPVRAQDFYVVGNTPRWGNLPITSLFQPFPLEFGEWETLDVNKPYPKRDRDGFIVATITHVQDANRGWIIGRQTVGNDLAPCAAASMHVYDRSDSYQYVESFCMPVVKGNDFQIDYTPTYYTPKVTAYWIALGSSHKMLPLESRRPNEINAAETNGILIGYLYAGRSAMPLFDNSEGTLNLFTSKTEDFKNQVLVTRTTAQYSDGVEKWIPYNSATAVVHKGTYYRAQFDQTPGSAVTATIRRFGAEPDKKIVDGQAASPSSWKTPFIPARMAW
jgi:hypothetical protein